MKKQFAIKVLQRIQELDAKSQELNKLGIDLTEFNDRSIDLMTEAVALQFANNDRHLEQCFSDIFWWLYDTSPKVVHLGDISTDISKVEDFVDWLEDWYSK